MASVTSTVVATAFDSWSRRFWIRTSVAHRLAGSQAYVGSSGQPVGLVRTGSPGGNGAGVPGRHSHREYQTIVLNRSRRCWMLVSRSALVGLVTVGGPVPHSTPVS